MTRENGCVVPSCCYSEEYEEHFTPREASRTARRFRRRGLRGSALELVDAVSATGLGGATVLEVGGGVGHLHVRLLQAGAASAVNVELSPSWETAASDLLADLGLDGRVDRRIGDLVDDAAELPQADVVVLHRVMCCYPDWRAMADAAVSRADRVLGITIPVDRRWTRAVGWAENRIRALRGRSFRTYVHPADDVFAHIRRQGFRTVHDHHSLVWRTVVLERTD